MRVHVQRVKEASCRVDNKIVSSIQKGFLLLVGFTQGDTLEVVEYMANKIAKLRVFEDEDGKLNKSILDEQLQILSISQFTLYGDTKKGNRPSFTTALEPKQAKYLYHELTKKLLELGIETVEGRFGQMMDIALINEGPVTLLLER